MSDKAAFRKTVRDKIRSLDEEYLLYSDAAIANRFLILTEFLRAKRIFAYFSVGREVDTHEIIRQAWRLEKEIYLPVVLGDGCMEFARYDLSADIQPGLLRVPEPDVNAVRAVPSSDDLIIVPGLCFDTEKFRMGQGGGYYDRYLAGCSAFSVGLAREKLMTDAVPRECFDLSVDLLLTEQRVFH